MAERPLNRNEATIGVDVIPDGVDWYGHVIFADHPDFAGLEIVMIPITDACSENEAAWNVNRWVKDNIVRLYELRKQMLAKRQLATHVVNVMTRRIERR